MPTKVSEKGGRTRIPSADFYSRKVICSSVNSMMNCYHCVPCAGEGARLALANIYLNVA